jgi:hypothetical protein
MARCSECRKTFTPAASARLTQRVCSVACRNVRDRRQARVRRGQDIEGAREDERERQRASRTRRRESAGHEGASPLKASLSQGQIAAIVYRALASSRASLVLQMGVIARRSWLDLGNAWRLSRGSLGP